MKEENIDRFASLFHQLIVGKVESGKIDIKTGELQHKKISFVVIDKEHVRYTILNPLRNRLSAEVLKEINDLAKLM